MNPGLRSSSSKQIMLSDGAFQLRFLQAAVRLGLQVSLIKISRWVRRFSAAEKQLDIDGDNFWQ